MHKLMRELVHTIICTYTAEAAIAKNREQRMNVAFTCKIKPSFNMPMRRRYAL